MATAGKAPAGRRTPAARGSAAAGPDGPAGTTILAPPPVPGGVPTKRWSSRAQSLAEIEHELGQIWASSPRGTTAGEAGEPHVAARTSVLNLVVITRRPEMEERATATITELAGRVPSRTVVVLSRDPDGPSRLDAIIEAFCVVPRVGAAETCAELIHLAAGGEAGHHLDSLISPLLIHDLPVTLWWPGETPLGLPATRRLVEMTDRLIVDGSSWTGNGLEHLGELAAMIESRTAICDFALIRQSRWREAIASTFDLPEFLPYLRSIRRIAVTYATHDETGDPAATNIVKPIYHVAWLGSRLGYHVERHLTPTGHGARSAVSRAATEAAAGGPGGAGAKSQPATRRATLRAAANRPASSPVPGGFDATLRGNRGEIAVLLRPRLSSMPSGTTLRVELLAERLGSELRADVTAEAESVHVRVWLDGVEVLERRFNAPRRTDVDLLAETIETSGKDPVSTAAIRFAGEILVGPKAAAAGPAETSGATSGSPNGIGR